MNSIFARYTILLTIYPGKKKHQAFQCIIRKYFLITRGIILYCIVNNVTEYLGTSNMNNKFIDYFT